MDRGTLPSNAGPASAGFPGERGSRSQRPGRGWARVDWRHAVLGLLLAASAALGLMLARRILLSRVSVQVASAPRAPGEVPWRGDSQYIVDPVVGWRPRSNVTIRHRVHSLDGAVWRMCERHQNNLGFIRATDWHPGGSAPRILLVGDSHMMGVVSTSENAAALLEARLRGRTGLGSAEVLNASSGYYSFYQYALRATEVASLVEPRALVVVVFLGNDILELEDPSRPHLDDRLEAEPAGAPSSGAKAWHRLESLQLLPTARPLFDQGLNQASFLQEEPQRRDLLLKKVDRTVEILQELARQHRSELLLVLLPSYEMVFPERAAALAEPVARLLRGSPNLALLEDLKGILTRRGCAFADLLPEFRRRGTDQLYASDYHIWLEGHQLVAEAVEQQLLTKLATGPP